MPFSTKCKSDCHGSKYSETIITKHTRYRKRKGEVGLWEEVCCRESIERERERNLL